MGSYNTKPDGRKGCCGHRENDNTHHGDTETQRKANRAFHEPADWLAVPQTLNLHGRRPPPHSETSEVTENGIAKQPLLRGRSP